MGSVRKDVPRSLELERLGSGSQVLLQEQKSGSAP